MGKYQKMSKGMRKEREKDFENTNDVNAALFGNLMRSSKGRKKRLGKRQGKILDKMTVAQQGLKEAGRRSEGRFRKTADKADMGGMLGQAAGQMAGDIGNVASAVNTAARGQMKVGHIAARSGTKAVAIARAGAKEAASNADALAADALTQRAQVDATTIATMKHAEAMARLTAKLEAEEAARNFERQKTLIAMEEKKAESALEKEGLTFSQYKPVINGVAGMVPEIARVHQNNPGASVMDIKQKLLQQGLITEADAESPVVTRLINSLTSDTQKGPDDVAEEFIAAMSIDPNWGNLRPNARKRLKSYITEMLKGGVQRSTTSTTNEDVEGTDDPDGFNSTAGGASLDNWSPF